MIKAWLKYREVGLTTMRSRWAYIWEQVLSAVFMMVVIFVFVQLWRVTFGAESAEIEGFTLNEMIWYLVATESIVWSLPRVHGVIEQEVKTGDLAMRLNKPYSYLLFHYSAFLGEGILRLATALLVMGLTAFLTVGGFDFRWEAIPVLLVVYVTTSGLHFCFNGAIGLAAFWMEDIQGLYLLLDRLKWLAGGLLLPVELYPGLARQVVEVLPFQHMIAGPSRLFVKSSWAGAWQLWQTQLIWALVFGLLCAGIYRLGVRRVDVNGG